ncbi:MULTISPECIES: MarR family transcriptional regulator [unclassified Streptomyces]|uniref:MarR family transcriptional regulator n=1 Tax=unclassified Streptomyces TaxID=2593676 RepID=UPI002E1541C6|nr:MarR family transcriptional regulator [Streptomyces sp. NBC_01208]
MAVQHPSSAPCAPAPSRPYARANPGYGKRSAPDQQASRPDDFALLPERERYVAGYVDHLPEGAAMDIKSLARSLPLYGQMAVGSALRALGVAGHLRHVRVPADAGGGQVRWITRTYWSRTARDNEWWTAFLTGAPGCSGTSGSAPATSGSAPAPVPPAASDTPALPPVPQQRTEEPGTEEQRPAPAETSGASPAYLVLARLGRADARLALSAADCAALEGLAAAWLARGVGAEYMVQTLTAGLPAAVASPVGFVRRRLRDRVPPEMPVAPAPEASGAPVPRPMVECTECGAPGRPEALPDGLCRSCRTPGPTATATALTAPEVSTAPTAPGAPVSPAERDVKAYVGTLRELLRLP